MCSLNAAVLLFNTKWPSLSGYCNWLLLRNVAGPLFKRLFQTWMARHYFTFMFRIYNNVARNSAYDKFKHKLLRPLPDISKTGSPQQWFSAIEWEQIFHASYYTFPYCNQNKTISDLSRGNHNATTIFLVEWWNALARMRFRPRPTWLKLVHFTKKNTEKISNTSFRLIWIFFTSTDTSRNTNKQFNASQHHNVERSCHIITQQVGIHNKKIN